jgi:hypothetical protein
MAIKHRYFKSTQGVPFEFAAATTTPAVSVTSEASGSFTFDTIVTGTPVAGDFYLLRQNPTTGVVTAAKNDGNAASGWRVNTSYRTWPHSLAWCVNASEKQFYVSAQFTPEKCDPMEVYSYSAAAAQVSTLTSTGIPVGAMQELYFKIIETTPGNLPLPMWDYNVTLNAAVTEAQAWTMIAQKINYGSYSATSGSPKEGEWFTAVAGTNGITITASSDTNPNQIGRNFKLVATLLPTKADATDYGVTFAMTTATAASVGVGTAAMVEDMFTEALVRQGIGHFYAPEGTVASEFGVPGTLASIVGTNTYNIYKISGTKTEAAKTPVGVTTNKFYIFIAVDTNDNTVFLRPFGGSSAYNN